MASFEFTRPFLSLGPRTTNKVESFYVIFGQGIKRILRVPFFATLVLRECARARRTSRKYTKERAIPPLSMASLGILFSLIPNDENQRKDQWFEFRNTLAYTLSKYVRTKPISFSLSPTNHLFPHIFRPFLLKSRDIDRVFLRSASIYANWYIGSIVIFYCPPLNISFARPFTDRAQNWLSENRYLSRERSNGRKESSFLEPPPPPLTSLNRSPD